MPDNDTVPNISTEISLESIVVPVTEEPEDLPPSYSYSAPAPPPTCSSQGPAAAVVGPSSDHIHLATPCSSAPNNRVVANEVMDTPLLPPPPSFAAVVHLDEILPNYLDATCDNICSGIPWSLPTNGTITYTILPHHTVPFRPPTAASTETSREMNNGPNASSAQQPLQEYQGETSHDGRQGEGGRVNLESSSEGGVQGQQQPQDTDTQQDRRGEEEEDEGLEVIAKQRVRHPGGNRRTDSAHHNQQTQAQGQSSSQDEQQTTSGHQQERPIPEHSQQTSSEEEEGESDGNGQGTAAATTRTGEHPTLLETVRMLREGLWAFEYWVEDAIMFMSFPVRLKHRQPRALHHPHHSSRRGSVFCHYDDLEVRGSYESISDLPTPAPVTSSTSYHHPHSCPHERPTDGILDTPGSFAGGSTAFTNSAEGASNGSGFNARRGSSSGGGILSRTFSSASSIGSNGGGGPPPIPPYANLFALVSATDPSTCLWRSTCYGERLGRCVQMCTNEDVMMWWRERMDQTYEFGREIETPNRQLSRQAQQRPSDLEAGSNATTSAAAGAPVSRFAIWRRFERRFATRATTAVSPQDQPSSSIGATSQPSPSEAAAPSTSTLAAATAPNSDHPHQHRLRQKNKKKKAFFDRRDWERGLWYGIKTMLVKIGVREIPAPHNETMEMAMRLRGLYYCWREVTHTHLESDDEDDDDYQQGGDIRGNFVDETNNARPANNGANSHQDNTRRQRTNSMATEISVRDAIRRARNQRRRRGKGRGRARMFVFDRDDALVNGKRIRGMIVAEIWIGHDEPTPQEAEEERRMEEHRRQVRRNQRYYTDRWADNITGTVSSSSSTGPDPTAQQATSSNSLPPVAGATTTGAGTAVGNNNPFNSVLRRRRCMLRVRQGLSADVETFILMTGPRLPELFEVFDHASYRPRISRCRVVLYSIITITVFSVVFFTKLASLGTHDRT